MAITFDFYRTPSASGKSKDASENYHARVVGGTTVGLDSLVSRIQQRCTLSKGDITAAVDELSTELVNELSNGNHVYLPGIGYFSLSLSAPKNACPEQTHNQHIQVKKVEFRADQHLKDALKERATFRRSPLKHHSAVLSEEEIERKLCDTFNEVPYLSRPDFAKLTGLTRMTAQRQLDRFVEAGKMVKKGSPHFPMYLPTKKLMKD